MDHFRGEQAYADMPVFVVVPGKEALRKAACVFNAAKTTGEIGPVLECLELGLGIGVIIAGMWPAVGFSDPQVGQQERHRLGFHGGATVGMDGELAGLDLLFLAGLLDQAFGKLGALTGSHHPPDHIAAEDVENHVEVVVGPFDGAKKLGGISGPDLIGARGQELRFLVRGMTQLIAPFLDLAMLIENPVHGADRAQVTTFIEKGGIDFMGCLIDKAWGMKGIYHGLSFLHTQGTWRTGTALEHQGGSSASCSLPIKCRAANVQGLVPLCQCD
jgi:hypothetical protein